MAKTKVRTRTISVKAYWRRLASGKRRRISAYEREIVVSSKPVIKKPAVKPVSRKPVVKPGVKKPVAKPVTRKPVAKPVTGKPVAKPVVRKPVTRKPVVKPKVKPAVKPKVKQQVKPPVKKPVKKPAKPVPKKVVKPGVKKPVAKPPVKKPIRKPSRKPPVKRKPPRKKVKRKYPPFMRQAMEAENMIQEKLFRLMDFLRVTESGLQMSVRSFPNTDATVDGELRISNLPDEWRTIEGLPQLDAAMSNAITGMGAFPLSPSIGGRFWVSFGLRFGPKNMAEIEEMAKFYKRFRGLFQVGAHHSPAHNVGAIITNSLALRMFIERVWAKRDLPPVQILVRFVWTPTTKNPGRDASEIGIKE